MTAAVEAFIARWQGQEGGQERENYAQFLTEMLCCFQALKFPLKFETVLFGFFVGK